MDPHDQPLIYSCSGCSSESNERPMSVNRQPVACWTRNILESADTDDEIVVPVWRMKRTGGFREWVSCTRKLPRPSMARLGPNLNLG